MPKVFFVEVKMLFASAKFFAFISIYLSLRVHWNPSYVSFIESNPASWTVRPAFDIPVKAPIIPGYPIVV